MKEMRALCRRLWSTVWRSRPFRPNGQCPLCGRPVVLHASTYRHLDGADDGSGDKAGTDRGMFGAWSPAVQRPLHEGVEREVPADTVTGQRRLPLARGRSPGQVREELRRFTFNPAALATDPRFRSAPGPLIAARHSEAALRFFMASLPALP